MRNKQKPTDLETSKNLNFIRISFLFSYFPKIFEELDLFEKIMTFCQETTNKFRKGLIAILIDFANSINDNSEEIECFNAYITTS